MSTRADHLAKAEDILQDLDVNGSPNSDSARRTVDRAWLHIALAQERGRDERPYDYDLPLRPSPVSDEEGR